MALFGRKSPESSTGDQRALSRRTLLMGGVGLTAAAALALTGCAPATTETPPASASPSEGNPPATPEKEIPKDIFNASFEEIKPLTQDELYSQTNPKFSPDYLMGENMEDDGHLNEVSNLFAINLDPNDYETDKEFVQAYVKEWFDRYNALLGIGLSGRGEGIGSDRDRIESAAIDMYRAMTGDRRDATISPKIVNSLMVSGTAQSIYLLALDEGVTPQFPIANVLIPDMDSIRYEGSRTQGFSAITLDARRVWKVDTAITEASIGPSPNNAPVDGVTEFTLSDVKVNPSTHRVAAKSKWAPFTNRVG